MNPDELRALIALARTNGRNDQEIIALLARAEAEARSSGEEPESLDAPPPTPESDHALLRQRMRPDATRAEGHSLTVDEGREFDPSIFKRPEFLALAAAAALAVPPVALRAAPALMRRAPALRRASPEAIAGGLTQAPDFIRAVKRGDYWDALAQVAEGTGYGMAGRGAGKALRGLLSR